MPNRILEIARSRHRGCGHPHQYVGDMKSTFLLLSVKIAPVSRVHRCRGCWSLFPPSQLPTITMHFYPARFTNRIYISPTIMCWLAVGKLVFSECLANRDVCWARERSRTSHEWRLRSSKLCTRLIRSTLQHFPLCFITKLSCDAFVRSVILILRYATYRYRSVSTIL